MHKILPNSNPTALDAWESLKQHFQNTKHTTLKEHFKEEPNRLDYTVLEWEEFYVDFSKNRLDKKGFDLLLKLAKESGLKEAIAAQFSGNKINVTEDRAVLHTALRTLKKDPLLFEGENVLPALAETQQKMYAFCDNVISGAWKGYTGKAITHIVNIGIGGSDLGPAMVVEALEYYKNHLDVRFVSNVEGDHHQEVIKDLNPETTLFVIVSKRLQLKKP
jgi:glucose-6-phosphate isomerase